MALTVYDSKRKSRGVPAGIFGDLTNYSLDAYKWLTQKSAGGDERAINEGISGNAQKVLARVFAPTILKYVFNEFT